MYFVSGHLNIIFLDRWQILKCIFKAKTFKWMKKFEINLFTWNQPTGIYNKHFIIKNKRVDDFTFARWIRTRGKELSIGFDDYVPTVKFVIL